MPTNREMIVKRAIIDALDTILATKDFERISVQDICDQAQVSRTTFYRHFKDKFHLVNWSYENYKDILNVRGPENETYQLSLSYLLAYLRQRRNFFICALKYTGQNSLSSFMLEITDEYMMDTYADYMKGKAADKHQRRMVLYAAAGAAEIIRQWLLAGCIDEPADVVDDITDNTRAEMKAALGVYPDWRQRAEALGKAPGNPWK